MSFGCHNLKLRMKKVISFGACKAWGVHFFLLYFWCFRTLCWGEFGASLSLLTLLGRNFKKIKEISAFDRGNNIHDCKIFSFRKLHYYMVSISAEVCLVLFHIYILNLENTQMRQILLLLFLQMRKLRQRG